VAQVGEAGLSVVAPCDLGDHDLRSVQSPWDGFATHSSDKQYHGLIDS